MLTKYWNPYLETYMAFVGNVLQAYIARTKCIEEYSFAVPNHEAIETLVHYSPVFEVGCGIGYWAKLVQDAGGEIIPYDANVNDEGMVKQYMSKDEYTQPYTQVLHGGIEVAELHSDKALFLCWPPYQSSIAHECLKTYLEYGGQTLIYVGEGYGGCTGDDAFHDLIKERMECVKTINIPTWPGIHDYMDVYTLKTT